MLKRIHECFFVSVVFAKCEAFCAHCVKRGGDKRVRARRKVIIFFSASAGALNIIKVVIIFWYDDENEKKRERKISFES